MGELGQGQHRDDVHDVSAVVFRHPGHFDEVFVVDAGDEHRIDFDQHAAIGSLAQPRQLVVVEQFKRLAATIGFAVVPYMRIDLLADSWIHRVNRDGQRGNPGPVNRLNAIRQQQPVGRDAARQAWKLGLDALEGGERGLVCEGITGASHAQHLQARVAGDGLANSCERLVGRNDAHRHAGPVLVGAGKLTDAVITLNVAARGHRNVDPPEAEVGGAAVTRVRADINFRNATALTGTCGLGVHCCSLGDFRFGL